MGGPRPVETYGSEPSKRHTMMSYEPEAIPDMEYIEQRPSPIKKKKEKVCKNVRDCLKQIFQKTKTKLRFSLTIIITII